MYACHLDMRQESSMQCILSSRRNSGNMIGVSRRWSKPELGKERASEAMGD